MYLRLTGGLDEAYLRRLTGLFSGSKDIKIAEMRLKKGGRL
jgi:hypothetical protein